MIHPPKVKCIRKSTKIETKSNLNEFISLSVSHSSLCYSPSVSLVLFVDSCNTKIEIEFTHMVQVSHSTCAFRWTLFCVSLFTSPFHITNHNEFHLLPSRHT